MDSRLINVTDDWLESKNERIDRKYDDNFIGKI